MFDDIYHNRVLELAADIPHAELLPERPLAPGERRGRAFRVSRICGSEMTVDVIVDGEGEAARITDIGLLPKACALGQASASVLAREAIGAHPDEVRDAHRAMRAMLKEDADPPAGRFWELRHLQGVRTFPQRHQSALLALDAAVAALDAAGA